MVATCSQKTLKNNMYVDVCERERKSKLGKMLIFRESG